MDTITLSVPARAEHTRLARLLAAAVATGAGFDIDEVEDVRIAVDELCSALVASAAPGSMLELTLRTDGDGLAVEGRTDATGDSATASALLDGLAAHVLAATADDHGVVRDGDVTRAWMSKRHSAA